MTDQGPTRLAATLLAMLAMALVGPAHAEPTGLVPYDLASAETVDGTQLVLWAYGAVLAGVTGYAATLLWRARRVAAAIERLESRLRRADTPE